MLRGEFECRQVVFWGTGTKRLGTPALDNSKSSHASFPALILLNPNNHYNHGFHNTFDYKQFIYSDYLLFTVTASVHIIR